MTEFNKLQKSISKQNDFQAALKKIKQIEDKERAFNHEKAEKFADRYLALDVAYKKMSQELKDLQQERDFAENELIEELKLLKAKQKYNHVHEGQGYNLSVNLVPKFWFLKENEQEAFSFVRDIGLSDIIKTSINHVTFNARLNDKYKLDSNGRIEGLPEFVKTSTSYRLKKNKTK